MPDLLRLKAYHIAVLSVVLLSPLLGYSQAAISTNPYNRNDSVHLIYDKSLEVNKFLKKGLSSQVLLRANNIIDSFPKYILQTPYYAYLNYYKGSAYKALGNYYLSEMCYQLANLCFIHNRDFKAYISSQNNLASTFVESKQYHKARDILEDLLARFTDSLSESDISNIYGNLAVVGLKSNDTVLCNRSFKRVFKINEENSAGEHARFITERNYGRYMISRNRPGEAEEYLNKALRGAVDSLGRNHFQTGLCYMHLGELSDHSGLQDSSLHYFSKALRIFENKIQTTGELSNPHYETILIECYQKLGNLRFETGSSKKALSCFELAIDRLNYLSHSVNAESSRFVIAEKGREVFNSGVEVAVKMYSKTGNTEYFRKAFEWSLQAKSFSLHWLAEKEQFYRSLNIPGDLVENLKSLRKNLDYEISHPDSKNLNIWLNKTGNLLRAYEKNESLISLSYPDLAVLRKDLSSVELIRKGLGRNEVYFGYFDTGEKLLAFSLEREQYSVREICIDEDLKNRLERMKSIVSESPKANYTAADVEEFSRISSYLYEILLGPLVTEKKKSIAIHPDGLLLGLPFEALTKEQIRIENFSGMPFIFKEHKIRYVASPFLMNTTENKIRKKGKLALISCNEPEGADNIETEIAQIREIYRKSEIISIDNADFTPERIINYDKIHIASHLLLNRGNPIVTGLTCKQGGQESELDFSDLLYLDLDGKQVFINACESGTGPINAGEGLMSLGLSFALAGCDGIIQHLWKAPDYSARQLALKYYKAHNKYWSPSIALSNSKEDYLQTCDIGYDHPYYWAGSIYYGERGHKSDLFPFFLICTFFICLAIIIILYKKKATFPKFFAIN